MPLLLLIGAGSLGVGAGTKLFGSGVNDAASGAMKLVVVAAVGAALYYHLRKG